MEIETEPRVAWENPFPRYRVGAGSLALIEEMDSLAQAVRHDRPTRWDAREGRKDLELEIAVNESGRRGREPLALPLRSVTAHEERLHDEFRTKYGHDAFDVEALVDVFFPKI
jgi:hypothetical protein